MEEIIKDILVDITRKIITIENEKERLINKDNRIYKIGEIAGLEDAIKIINANKNLYEIFNK